MESPRPRAIPPADRFRQAILQHATVCALVLDGQLEQARQLAAAIQVEHLRAEALKVANFSTSVTAA